MASERARDGIKGLVTGLLTAPRRRSSSPSSLQLLHQCWFSHAFVAGDGATDAPAGAVLIGCAHLLADVQHQPLWPPRRSSWTALAAIDHKAASGERALAALHATSAQPARAHPRPPCPVLIACGSLSCTHKTRSFALLLRWPRRCSPPRWLPLLAAGACAERRAVQNPSCPRSS